MLPWLLAQARSSRRWLWVLNMLLGRVIPFNSPHGFRVTELEKDRVVTKAPYRRRNHNHIRGIHACAIATIAEFSAGMMLLVKLEPKKYRLIMSHLEVEYLYQAKQVISSVSKLNNQRLQECVLAPLLDQEAPSITMESLVHDEGGNLVARARTTWQVKRWKQVRTQL